MKSVDMSFAREHAENRSHTEIRVDTASAKPTDRGLSIARVDAFMKPAWVDCLLGRDPSCSSSIERGDLEIEITEGRGLTFLQVVLPEAIELASRDFERRVTEVYGVLSEKLQKRRSSHPLRFWNFIPGIHQPGHDGMVRYEVFNAGRFAAFSEWYGTHRFGGRMIAASGIGHHSPHFVVQLLAAERPGRGLENPRQRAAYRYSKKYGPMPPCFARATVVDPPTYGLSPDREWVLVSGTASVVGEDTWHLDDLEGQLEETWINLECLLEAARPSSSTLGKGTRDLLSCFRELRVYMVDPTSEGRLVEAIAARLPRLCRLETMPAKICRADLLVEIEGVVGL